MITIKNLTKRYNNNFLALDDVSFEIPSGSFFGLLGLNGAGKSTFINILCSLVKKTSGNVTYDKLNLDTDVTAIKRKIGIMPQEINLNPFTTVEQALTYQAGYYGLAGPGVLDKINALLQELTLESKRHTEIRMLSGGMKRRVLLARSLVTNPEYLFLDEPTAGVDVDLRRDIYELLRSVHKQGTTVILTSHYMEDVESLCHDLAIINQGKIVKSGPLNEIDLGCQTQPAYIITFTESLQDIPHVKDVDTKKISEKMYEITLNSSTSICQWISTVNQMGLTIEHISSSKNRLESYMSQLTSASS